MEDANNDTLTVRISNKLFFAPDEHEPHVFAYISHGITDTHVAKVEGEISGFEKASSDHPNADAISHVSVFEGDATIVFRVRRETRIPHDARLHVGIRAFRHAENNRRVMRLVGSGSFLLSTLFKHRDHAAEVSEVVQPTMNNLKKGYTSAKIISSECSPRLIEMARNLDDSTTMDDFTLTDESIPIFDKVMCSFIECTEFNAQLSEMQYTMPEKGPRVHMPLYTMACGISVPTVFYFMPPREWKNSPTSEWTEANKWLVHVIGIACSRLGISTELAEQTLDRISSNKHTVKDLRMAEDVLQETLAASANRFPYVADSQYVYDAENERWVDKATDRYGKTNISGVMDCEDGTSVASNMLYALQISGERRMQTVSGKLGRFSEHFVPLHTLMIVSSASLRNDKVEDSDSPGVMEFSQEETDRWVKKDQAHMCMILQPLCMFVDSISRGNKSVPEVDAAQLEFSRKNKMRALIVESTGFMRKSIVPETLTLEMDGAGKSEISAMHRRLDALERAKENAPNLFLGLGNCTPAIAQTNGRSVSAEQVRNKTYKRFGIFYKYVTDVFSTWPMRKLGIPVTKWTVGMYKQTSDGDNIQFMANVPIETFLFGEDTVYYTYAPLTPSLIKFVNAALKHEEPVPLPSFNMQKTMIHPYSEYVTRRWIVFDKKKNAHVMHGVPESFRNEAISVDDEKKLDTVVLSYFTYESEFNERVALAFKNTINKNVLKVTFVPEVFSYNPDTKEPFNALVRIDVHNIIN
jgi:hypothetical protein